MGAWEFPATNHRTCPLEACLELSVTQCGKLRRALGRAHREGPSAGWPGCKHLPPSCPSLKDMVGFLAKQKLKSADSEDREMKTVLWAEEGRAAWPADLTSTFALESSLVVLVLRTTQSPGACR